MSLIDTARQLWLVIRNEKVKNANTAERVGDAGAAILDAFESSITGKVDKNGTDRLITQTEVSKLAGINEHYRGTYLSLTALKSAIPLGVEGNEAVVDAGVGSDPQKYIWDVSDNDWRLGSGTAITVDQSINQGSANPVSGGSVYNGLNSRANKSTQTVTDPITQQPRVADVDLAVNAVSAVSADTAGMAVKDRFNHTIDTWYATKQELRDFIFPPGVEALGYAMSDAATDITAGVKVPCAAVPYAFTITSIRAQLGRSAIGVLRLTIDIKKNGSSIFSTLLTFDNSETTSEGASIPYVMTSDSINLTTSDVLELSVAMAGGVTQAAQNLTLFLIGYKTI